MNKRKSRGAKFAEGEQAVCLNPAAAERNGGHPPIGTVLRATKRSGGTLRPTRRNATHRTARLIFTA